MSKKLKLGKPTRTARGFPIVLFEDRYGNKCSLQGSCLADNKVPGTGAIWLGADTEPGQKLDRKQVKALIGHLQTWLKEGKF